MLKRLSELDLAVEGKLTEQESAELADAFEESRCRSRWMWWNWSWWMQSFGSGLRRILWWWGRVPKQPHS
jgi:hypothetical protein